MEYGFTFAFALREFPPTCVWWQLQHGSYPALPPYIYIYIYIYAYIAITGIASSDDFTLCDPATLTVDLFTSK